MELGFEGLGLDWVGMNRVRVSDGLGNMYEYEYVFIFPQGIYISQARGGSSTRQGLGQSRRVTGLPGLSKHRSYSGGSRASALATTGC